MQTKYKLILTCVIIVSFCLVYVIYRDRNPTEIVTLYPEEGEIKIKPLDPGGIATQSNENLIYDNFKPQTARSAGSKAIILLPEPEQPINIINKMDNEEIDPIGSILADISEEKKTNKVVLQEPDNAEFAEQLLDDPISSIIEETKPVETQSRSLKIVKVDKQSNILLPPCAFSENEPTTYRLQLVSVKTESEGEKSWERLKQKNPKVLGKLTMQLKKIKHANGSIFYSVQAGSYNSINAAKAVCKRLSNSGIACIPVR